jgi:hypothetical protein
MCKYALQTYNSSYVDFLKKIFDPACLPAYGGAAG